MSEPTVKPFGFRVLVEIAALEDERTSGGLYIPGTSSKSVGKGKVVAVGKGELPENGLELNFPFKEGDTVVFDPLGPVEIAEGGKKYLLVPGRNVYAWIPAA